MKAVLVLIVFLATQVRAETVVFEANPNILYISGIASRFNEVDNVFDTVHRGAFAGVIEKFNLGKIKIPIRVDHNSLYEIGQWTRLTETAEGLYVEGYIDLASPGARPWSPVNKRYELPDILTDLKSRKHLSIGYIALKTVARGRVRVLQEIMLLEISIVRSPTLQSTTYNFIRSLPHQMKCSAIFAAP